ncbi:MAG: HNH endonuclease [Bacillota bacterium]
MYLLDIPEYKIEDFFTLMLKGRHNNLKNQFLKSRLLSIKEILKEAQDEYILLGRDKLLYEHEVKKSINLPDDKVIEGISQVVSAEEMEKVYSNFMVDKPDSEKIGRKVYDSILSNTYYNLCPYCSHREVKTVDHFLPKSHFALYAVTPVNLLPSCSDCNKDKLDDYNLEEGKMLIHPYFDDIRSVDWLQCSVDKGVWPITFSFEVSDQISDTVLRSRIEHQFDLLNLGRLYADNSTREFNKRVKAMVKEYNSKPEEKALVFIKENIETYSYDNPNSWQTKMFESLEKSDWFLDEALPNLENFYLNS